MNNLYTIEYEGAAGAAGHTTVAAGTAREAVEEFSRNHPDIRDIVEMRRVHVPEQRWP